MGSEVTETIAAGIVLGVVMLASGILFTWASAAVRQDRIPPNDFIGVRTTWATASEEAWYAAQRASGPALRVMGVVSLTAGAIALAVAGAIAWGWIGTSAADRILFLAIFTAIGVIIGALFFMCRAAKRAVTRIECPDLH